MALKDWLEKLTGRNGSSKDNDDTGSNKAAGSISVGGASAANRPNSAAASMAGNTPLGTLKKSAPFSRFQSSASHQTATRPLTLYNTLSKRKEVFKPIVAGRAGVYDCGPTVYDYAHIGNLRSYVFADILRRTLEWNSYKVRQVINITDIGHLVGDGDGSAVKGESEDKMTQALQRENKPLTLKALRELADFYTEKFVDDLERLNIDTSRIIFPRASETIPEQIALIEELEKKGYVYKISDGMYFDTSKFPTYGKLGMSAGMDDSEKSGEKEKSNPSSQEASDTDTKKAAVTRARVAENPEKKNPRDFALWKFDDKLGWQTPWGKGFPGWHIECSAMAMANLGATLDIHTGGIDHISVHHNNEIAQSEAATGQTFVHYWMHNEFIRLRDEKTNARAKMAKSAGGFIKLKDLKISPLAYRYWLLGASYRTPIDYSAETLDTAATAYKRLLEQFSRFKKEAIISEAIQKTKTGEVSKGIISNVYLRSFNDAINDDLNTPAALAVLWELLGDATINVQDKVTSAAEFDRVLGLDIVRQAAILSAAQAKARIQEQKDMPADVRDLADKREQARRAKNWKLADELRMQIEKKGYLVKDVKNSFEIDKIGEEN